MDVRSVVIVEESLVDRQQPVVRQSLLFGNEGDHILPEAVYPLIQPEPHDLLDLLPDQRVIHIQVRLLDCEQMQIVFLADGVEGPGLALKVGVPVVGGPAVLGHGPPDIVIRVGLDPAAALLEPLVLIAGMVDDQVHNDLHALCVGGRQAGIEGLHAAEHGVDILIVRDVIAAVHPGRGVQGRKPQPITAQTFDIVQALDHAVQVPHAVAIAVPEAPGPDLIKNRILIPICMNHRSLLILLPASVSPFGSSPARTGTGWFSYRGS